MAPKVTARDTELSGRSAIRDRLIDVFSEVEKAFRDSSKRINDILDYWEAYECKLGQDQFYAGNSKVFIPIIQNAIRARKTRFKNQLFPQSGRYVKVVTSEDEEPKEHIALIEHYIKKAKLSTEIVPALLKAGDIEGQYNVYVSWCKRKRYVTEISSEAVKVDGVEMPEEYGEVEVTKSKWLEESYPMVEVISDSDVIVVPAIADSIEEALDRGGSVTIMRRWTKADIKERIRDGDFTREQGEALMTAMEGDESKQAKDVDKAHVKAAGIKGKGKYVLGFETWTKLKVDGEYRLCRAYYGGQDMILGCKLNPYWSDLCPLISHPVEKVAGSFKGMSQVGPQNYSLQLAANDAANEGLDSATYSLLPIIMTDPERNPRVGTMILDLAAVWEVDPNSTKFAEFPELFTHAFELISGIKNEIFQNLSVNPAMMPMSSGKPGAKRNQAEIANEQQVDIVATADAVGVLEEGVLNPMLERFVWLDMQFRDEEMIVEAFGYMGVKAVMTEIKPTQQAAKYVYSWLGVEAARNAQQIQQQISTMNVLSKLPPQMLGGRKLDFSAVVERLVENTFGPRLAPKVLISLEEQLSFDPEVENELMDMDFDVPVHAQDDDKKHIQAHQEAMQSSASPIKYRIHIGQHMQAMQQKAAQAQAQQQGQQPGQGGGQPPRGPQPGSQAQPPRGGGKGPPGMIPPEQLQGMPRKM